MTLGDFLKRAYHQLRNSKHNQVSRWAEQRRTSNGIRGKENVDKLAKAALNRASCSGKLIYSSDLKPKVNAYIHTTW
ncbi:hypothetical protein PoB_004660200 [Plakobranchus ocellatus]|uniref:Uncharacterized protein n=1 Tax=Plakobranchus ocellatus TaxID=259542 RepID=A0AAV4BL28_9GAST|nr:hypothetical protein PoB_004660200 [Plakobranchus ocellatus]